MDVSFSIYAMSKASDFKFGNILGLLRPIIISHPKEKVGVDLG